MSRGDPSGASEAAGPVVAAYEAMGSRWRIVVLWTLGDSEMRFNELKRATGASPRTLSRVLDDLRERNLVERRVEEDAPVATFYRRTERGNDLESVFRAMAEWADTWDLP